MGCAGASPQPKTEDPLNIAVNNKRSFLIAGAVALLLAGAAFALFSSAGTKPAFAVENDNNNNCVGSVRPAGSANPDDPTSYPATYQFRCEQTITGYSILIDGREVNTAETEVFPVDRQGNPYGAGPDSFSCGGTFPGHGINCVGKATGWEGQTKSTFEINAPVCREPRIEPILTVVTAGVNSKGAATTAVAGPFSLGRPHGCPKTKKKGVKVKIPKPDKGSQPVIQIGRAHV